VEEVKEEQAMGMGYGGETHSIEVTVAGEVQLHTYHRNEMNAYMLIYILESAHEEITKPVSDDEIPPYLVDRIQSDREAEEAAEAERLRRINNIDIRVLSFDIIDRY
jgi:hypothetical protein